MVNTQKDIIKLIKAAYKSGLIDAGNPQTKTYLDRGQGADVLELRFSGEERPYKLALRKDLVSVANKVEPVIRASSFVSALMDKISREYSCLTATVENKSVAEIKSMAANKLLLINGSKVQGRGVSVAAASGRSDIVEYEVQARFKIGYETIENDNNGGERVSGSAYVVDSFYIAVADDGKTYEISASDTTKICDDSDKLPEDKKEGVKRDVNAFLELLQGKKNERDASALIGSMEVKKKVVEILANTGGTSLFAALEHLLGECKTRKEYLTNVRISFTPLHIFINRRQMAKIAWTLSLPSLDGKTVKPLEMEKVTIDVGELAKKKKVSFTVKDSVRGGIEFTDSVCENEDSEGRVNQFFAAYYKNGEGEIKTVLSVSKGVADRLHLKSYYVTLGRLGTHYAEQHVEEYYVQPECNPMVVKGVDGAYYLLEDVVQLGEPNGSYAQNHAGYYQKLTVTQAANGYYYLREDLVALGKDDGAYRFDHGELYVNPTKYPSEKGKKILQAENKYYYLECDLIQLGKEGGEYRKNFKDKYYLKPNSRYAAEETTNIGEAVGLDGAVYYYLESSLTYLGADYTAYRTTHKGKYLKPNDKIFCKGDTAREVYIQIACDGNYYLQSDLKTCSYGEFFCGDAKSLLGGTQKGGFFASPSCICAKAASVAKVRLGKKCQNIVEKTCVFCDRKEYFSNAETTVKEYEKAFSYGNKFICLSCLRDAKTTSNGSLLLINEKRDSHGVWYPDGVVESNGNDMHIVKEGDEEHLVIAMETNSCPVCGEYMEKDGGTVCQHCREQAKPLDKKLHKLLKRYLPYRKWKDYLAVEEQNKPGHLFLCARYGIGYFDFIVKKEKKGKITLCKLIDGNTHVF